MSSKDVQEAPGSAEAGDETTAKSSRYSRRGFLGRVGLGAGAVAVGPGRALVGAAPAAAAPYITPSQNFGRIFPNLPSFAPANDRVRAALREVGKLGGIMDAKDDLSDPVTLITDPAKSANNQDQSAPHTAGTTFMGQFMDHDMTFDTTSILGVPTDPARSPNARVPTFDLDSVYLAGPTSAPQLYDPSDRAKLRVESGGLFEDLPRNAEGTAIIGDPRNDENIMLAGLHLAVILFHNKMVDKVRAERLVSNTNDANAVFTAARDQTRWHYQYMILNEFLPLFVGQGMVDDILRNGRRFYRPPVGGAFMPVEFQGAAYRFGHSMVRPSYRANFTGQPAGKPNSPQFFGIIFAPSQEGIPDPEDLRGGFRARRRFIGWPTFFDFGDGRVRRNKRIDTHISTPLFQLPIAAIAGGDPPTVLPQRNLLRQLTWSIPSGQAISRAMGIWPLDKSELQDIGDVGRAAGFDGLDTSTPLWFYCLRAAEHRAGSFSLGPVGGRIVGEVIIGLLQTDPSSFLFQSNWRPTAPFAGSRFQMTDFLTFAGVAGVR